MDKVIKPREPLYKYGACFDSNTGLLYILDWKACNIYDICTQKWILKFQLNDYATLYTCIPDQFVYDFALEPHTDQGKLKFFCKAGIYPNVYERFCFHQIEITDRIVVIKDKYAPIQRLPTATVIYCNALKRYYDFYCYDINKFQITVYTSIWRKL